MGRALGFCREEGWAARSQGPAVPLVLSPFPCGYRRRMRAGLSRLIYLFMNSVFFLCAHSSSQTFGQAAPLPRSGLGLAVEMPFLSFLSPLKPCFD